MISLNQIVNKVQEIADQHYMVKSFDAGSISQIDLKDQSGDLLYPRVFLHRQNASSTGGALYYNFELVVTDLVQDDRSNEQEVISDCMQIATDFVTSLERPEFFNQNTDSFLSPEQSINYGFLSEEYSDRVGGVVVTFQIKQAFTYNRCVLPTTGNSNCQSAPTCTDTINSLGADYYDCVLPSYDFTASRVQNAVTAQQQTDLIAWLCTGGADATVNVNNVLFNTVESGGTLNVPVEDTSGNAVGTIFGSDVVVADSSAVVLLQGSTEILTEPILAEASENITINVEYTDGTDVGSLNGTTVEIPNNRYNRSSQIKSGQTTSYRTNDDGDLERGRESSFTVLSSNNPFGNTNRFTDDTGAQTYTSNWVIDWAFVDYVNETVIGWFRTEQGGSGVNFSSAMAGQPYTLGGYADCYVPNISELDTLVQYEAGILLNYAPFNLTNNYWSSTTQPSNTNNAKFTGASGVANVVKTNTINYIVMRVFTFAQLGL